MRLGALVLAALLSSCAVAPAGIDAETREQIANDLAQLHRNISPAPTCQSGEKPLVLIEQHLRSRFGSSLAWEKADPALSAAIVTAYNRQPPASDTEADYVLVADRAGVPSVLALLVAGECVRGAFELPREVLIVLRSRSRT